MRKYEIDWIRNISILMLFVYHASVIFCDFGEFYIISEEKNMIANLIILTLFVWYMPMLFFLAGASLYFSSKTRSSKDYIKERVRKLFIPLVFGILILVPPQTYLARLWRGEAGINYFEHLKYFFFNLTDFTITGGKARYFKISCRQRLCPLLKCRDESLRILGCFPSLKYIF